MGKTQTTVTTPAIRAQAPRILDKLYDVLGVNTPTKSAYLELAELLGIGHYTMQSLTADFERSDILTKTYRAIKRPDGSIAGRHSYWCLPFQPEVARKMLADWYEKHPPETWRETRERRARSKITTISAEAEITPPTPVSGIRLHVGEDEPVAIRRVNGEAVEAIVGPEPEGPFEVLRPERKDEASALIEAARQYQSRRGAVHDKLRDLEKLGITIDWTNIDQVVHLETDERLETISLVLPYIDALSRAVDRVTERYTALRDRVRVGDAAITENARLKDQVKRLIAAKVGAQPIEPYR